MTREEEIHRMLRDLFIRSGARLGGHRVVLFGSRARGEAKPRSDFDLGVIGECPLPLEDFYALADQLDELPTLYRIDWVDLMRASETYRETALQILSQYRVYSELDQRRSDLARNVGGPESNVTYRHRQGCPGHLR